VNSVATCRNDSTTSAAVAIAYAANGHLRRSAKQTAMTRVRTAKSAVLPPGTGWLTASAATRTTKMGAVHGDPDPGALIPLRRVGEEEHVEQVHWN
jgi:hypothetical protein